MPRSPRRSLGLDLVPFPDVAADDQGPLRPAQFRRQFLQRLDPAAGQNQPPVPAIRAVVAPADAAACPVIEEYLLRHMRDSVGEAAGRQGFAIIFRWDVQRKRQVRLFVALAPPPSGHRTDFYTSSMFSEARQPSELVDAVPGKDP